MGLFKNFCDWNLVMMMRRKFKEQLGIDYPGLDESIVKYSDWIARADMTISEKYGYVLAQMLAEYSERRLVEQMQEFYKRLNNGQTFAGSQQDLAHWALRATSLAENAVHEEAFEELYMEIARFRKESQHAR